MKNQTLKDNWKPVQYQHELFSLKYKRSMYEYNDNIRKDCQRLAHLIWQSTNYKISQEKVDKWKEELSMWCIID